MLENLKYESSMAETTVPWRRCWLWRSRRPRQLGQEAGRRCRSCRRPIPGRVEPKEIALGLSGEMPFPGRGELPTPWLPRYTGEWDVQPKGWGTRSPDMGKQVREQQRSLPRHPVRNKKGPVGSRHRETPEAERIRFPPHALVSPHSRGWLWRGIGGRGVAGHRTGRSGQRAMPPTCTPPPARHRQGCLGFRQQRCLSVLCWEGGTGCSHLLPTPIPFPISLQLPSSFCSSIVVWGY